jgi:hypothetical protein
LAYSLFLAGKRKVSEKDLRNNTVLSVYRFYSKTLPHLTILTAKPEHADQQLSWMPNCQLKHIINKSYISGRTLMAMLFFLKINATLTVAPHHER